MNPIEKTSDDQVDENEKMTHEEEEQIHTEVYESIAKTAPDSVLDVPLRPYDDLTDDEKESVRNLNAAYAISKALMQKTMRAYVGMVVSFHSKEDPAPVKDAGTQDAW